MYFFHKYGHFPKIESNQLAQLLWWRRIDMSIASKQNDPSLEIILEH